MQVVMAVVVGALYAAGVFLILRRNIARLVVGLVMLGHATNLLILAAGGLAREAPPLIAAGASVPQQPIANSLPQAMILTAIVIGLAVQAFVLVLVRQAAVEGEDVEAMRTTDRI